MSALGLASIQLSTNQASADPTQKHKVHNYDIVVAGGGPAGFAHRTTSMHHDGFSMLDSKANHFNLVKVTPFKRDIMKELAHACKEHGLKFGFL